MHILHVLELNVNPDAGICVNSRYLKSIVNNSVIVCDEIIDVTDSVSIHVTNIVLTNATNTVLTNVTNIVPANVASTMAINSENKNL